MVLFTKLPLFIYVLIALAGGDRCHSNTSIPIQLLAHQSVYDIASQALYLFGGILPQSGHSQSIYKWDISTHTWNELSTSTPTSTLQGLSVNWFYSFVNAAVTIQDIVYFIGLNDGYYNSGTVYRFDLGSLQWLSLSVTAPPHRAIRGCLTDNSTHIFMVGGQSDNTSYIDQLQIYSVSSDIWSTETINIFPIHGQGCIYSSCQSVGIDLFTFGGSTSTSESNTIDNIFKYNPNDKWTSIGDLPDVQGYGWAVYREASGVIYLVGGFCVNTFAYLDTIHVFDVETESITDTLTMKQARGWSPAEIINDNLYVFGGEVGRDTASSSIEVCSIPQLSALDPTTNPSTAPIRNPSVSPTHPPSNHPVSTSNPTSYPTHHATTKVPSTGPTTHPFNPTDSPLDLAFSSTLFSDLKEGEGAELTVSSEERQEMDTAIHMPWTMIAVFGSGFCICCVCLSGVCYWWNRCTKIMKHKFMRNNEDVEQEVKGGEERMGVECIVRDEILEVVNETIGGMQQVQEDDDQILEVVNETIGGMQQVQEDDDQILEVVNETIGGMQQVQEDDDQILEVVNATIGGMHAQECDDNEGNIYDLDDEYDMQ
eukprot:256865_1